MFYGPESFLVSEITHFLMRSARYLPHAPVSGHVVLFGAVWELPSRAVLQLG